MCFSILVRKDDRLTVHSATQLTAEVGDCLIPRNIHLKTWQERVSYHPDIRRLMLQMKAMFLKHNVPSSLKDGRKIVLMLNTGT